MTWRATKQASIYLFIIRHPSAIIRVIIIKNNQSTPTTMTTTTTTMTTAVSDNEYDWIRVGQRRVDQK